MARAARPERPVPQPAMPEPESRRWIRAEPCSGNRLARPTKRRSRAPRAGLPDPETAEPPASIGPVVTRAPTSSQSACSPSTTAAMYEERLASLRASVSDSGVAEAVVDECVAVLTSRASDVIDPDTVRSEAAAIVAIIDGSQ